MSFTKDPVAVLDYTIDWGSGGWMPTGDSIASAQWSTDETYLPAPIDLIASPSTNGGNFAAGAYYWVVTALNAAGETVPSNEVEATLTGTTSSVALGWNQVQSSTGYNVYRGSNTDGTPVTIDASGTGTVGSNTGTPASSMTATCTYTCGASANYAVAVVPFIAGLQPSLLSCEFGTDAMDHLGTVVTGFGGLAFFGLKTPPTGTAQTVTATVQSYGDVIAMAVACASFEGWGSTVFTSGQGGQESSPSQTVPAVYGDLVVWAAANVAGSSVDTSLSGFNQTSLQNSGKLSASLADSLAVVLGYANGPTTGASSVAFSADVAQANIDQWWSAAALTLLPASPPINTLVGSISDPTVTTFTDTGAAGTAAGPPSSNTAATSVAIAPNPAPSTSTTTSTAWIEGGTAGSAYAATCKIVTAQGRVDQRTITIQVTDL